MNSILNSIKKLIGISEEDKNFDADLIMHINSVFGILRQMGVGPPEGFSIEDETATWEDFGLEDPLLSMVRDYMYMKVRLIFDPPQSSALLESMKQLISEFEWRAYVEAES